MIWRFEMLRIITDFDGPIVDVSERYYQVYLFCLREVQYLNQPINPLSKQAFWNLKRSQTPERQIGQLSGLDEAQAEKFSQLRKHTVHTLPYLVYDTPMPGAIDTLKRIQQAKVDLAVMTMRRVRELDNAFRRYELGSFFPLNRRFCLSNDYVKTADVKDKPLLMQRALTQLPRAEETWMVGDTEADLVAAKPHGIKAIAVLCGIRDRAQLMQHQPDHIVSNFSEAVDLIFRESNIASPQLTAL
jgi:phosphoglycolate phosphatase-like HAD superfamily hydrolase